MKADIAYRIFRIILALMLVTLTALVLFLVGTGQDFLEPTLEKLYALVRWLSWAGALGTVFVLVPLVRLRTRYLTASLVLGLIFFSFFIFILFWGSWIYPGKGDSLW